MQCKKYIFVFCFPSESRISFFFLFIVFPPLLMVHLNLFVFLRKLIEVVDIVKPEIIGVIDRCNMVC